MSGGGFDAERLDGDLGAAAGDLADGTAGRVVLEQVVVELAPFDVTYSGFSACNINAVTKSGENSFA